MVPTTERLSKLRALMATKNIQAYFVPSEDAHQVGSSLGWIAANRPLFLLDRANIRLNGTEGEPSFVDSQDRLAMLL